MIDKDYIIGHVERRLENLSPKTFEVGGYYWLGDKDQFLLQVRVPKDLWYHGFSFYIPRLEEMSDPVPFIQTVAEEINNSYQKAEEKHHA